MHTTPFPALTLKLSAEGDGPTHARMLECISREVPETPRFDAAGRPIYRGPPGPDGKPRFGWLAEDGRLMAESTPFGTYVTINPGSEAEGWAPEMAPAYTQYISFRNIVPPPPFPVVGIHAWRKRRWGCIRDAQRTFRNEFGSIMFDVHGGFPLPVLVELSALFPALVLDVEYALAVVVEPAGKLTLREGHLWDGEGQLDAFLSNPHPAPKGTP